MVLNVNFKSGKPVYIQIVDQIKGAAASGAVRPGDALPSIGPLALQLRVNRNAIAKAYSELEAEGLIESLAGKGYVIKDTMSPLRKDSRRKVLAAEAGHEIEHALRRSGQSRLRVLVAATLAVLHLAVAAGLALLIVRAWSVRGDWIAVLTTAAIAALLMPVRDRVQSLLDAALFATRHELPQALQAIKTAAFTQPDFDLFAQHVIQQTEAVLDTRLEWIRDYSEMSALVNSHPRLRSARSSPVPAGDDLLMPLFSGDELIGIVRLRARPARPFDTEERGFFAAAGEQVAIAANQFRLRKEKQEGEYALDIQVGLLPKEIPQAPGFTIAGAWQPARVVGGDYYDVFRLTGATAGLVVADVSGKGIPAALIMANLQATVRAYATPESPPKTVCEQVNRAVAGTITPGKFITFFYAVLDAAAQRIVYVNAGHNPPLLVRKDGACLKLEKGGMVLGIVANAFYEEASVDLLPGDRLALFTDGITEACDPNGDEFGENRVISLLASSTAANATHLRDEIMRDVMRFCREDLADDATLLTVCVEARS